MLCRLTDIYGGLRFDYAWNIKARQFVDWLRDERARNSCQYLQYKMSI